MNYDSIFSQYTTVEGINFELLTRSIVFPTDTDLPCYGKMYVDSDTAWTIMSYKIYDSIEFWWLLSALNKKEIFYAPENTEILYIKKEYLSDILSSINTVNHA